MAFLEVNNVSKGFGPAWKRTEVLHEINLSIDEGEFVAIVGGSGCGTREIPISNEWRASLERARRT